MDFRDLGFVPVFSATQDVTTKPYNSAREGITTIAFEPVVKVISTIKFTLNEIVGENLAYFALGEATTDTDGIATVTSLTKTQIAGILKCEGFNDVGQRVDWIGSVTLKPSGTMDLLTDGDDWSKIEMEAKVVKDNTYGWGIYTVRPQGV